MDVVFLFTMVIGLLTDRRARSRCPSGLSSIVLSSWCSTPTAPWAPSPRPCSTPSPATSPCWRSPSSSSRPPSCRRAGWRGGSSASPSLCVGHFQGGLAIAGGVRLHAVRRSLRLLARHRGRHRHHRHRRHAPGRLLQRFRRRHHLQRRHPRDPDPALHRHGGLRLLGGRLRGPDVPGWRHPRVGGRPDADDRASTSPRARSGACRPSPGPAGGRSSPRARDATRSGGCS